MRFRLLFDLVVADMCGLGWEDGGAAWQWRRRLWVGEDELLGECRILLHDFSV